MGQNILYWTVSRPTLVFILVIASCVFYPGLFLYECSPHGALLASMLFFMARCIYLPQWISSYFGSRYDQIDLLLMKEQYVSYSDAIAAIEKVLFGALFLYSNREMSLILYGLLALLLLTSFSAKRVAGLLSLQHPS